MIKSVTRDGATYAELPHKFEAGTVNAAGAVGLAAAIKYISEIGFDYIQQKEERLAKIAINGLKGHKHTLNKCFCFLLCIIEHKTCSCRIINSKKCKQWLCTVMSSPHIYSVRR